MTWPFKEGSLVRLNPDGNPHFVPYDNQTWQHVRALWAQTRPQQYTDVVGTAALVTKVHQLSSGDWVFTPLLLNGEPHLTDYMEHWELVREPDDA